MATYWENSCSFGLRNVSWYKYLIVSLVFSHLSFWSGNLFLIAPFPDLCLLVPFCKNHLNETQVHECFVLNRIRLKSSNVCQEAVKSYQINAMQSYTGCQSNHLCNLLNSCYVYFVRLITYTR